MDKKNLQLAAGLVKPTYIAQAGQALNSRHNLVTALLANRRLPPTGWDEATIEYLLSELAMMDSNNFLGNVGVGEREARIFCPLVARRCFRLAHGVGRSGDIAEVQPKAAGSSLMSALCACLARDALRVAGLANARAALVLPLATGMALALTLAALRGSRPPGARLVLWPRVDQKSCLKAIATAGFTPIMIPNILDDSGVVRMDAAALSAAIEAHGADRILCVVTTASCFAPRVRDDVDVAARLCARAGIAHVVNNAYGLQCRATTALVNRAMAVGRVDAVVQSTDKNFMVPVGGAIVCGPDAAFIARVGKTYAGRASSAPALDLFITLLSMGADGYRRLLDEREARAKEFRAALAACAAAAGEALIAAPDNTISFAITLRRVRDPRRVGAALSGGGATSAAAAAASAGAAAVASGAAADDDGAAAAVAVPAVTTVAGLEFRGYGSSVDEYPCAYLTAACAIGMRQADTDEFIARLSKVFAEAQKQRGRSAAPCAAAAVAADGGSLASQGAGAGEGCASAVSEPRRAAEDEQ
ncbi:O-phosphoseryl-tRNA selenium transferase [Tribonema minus]|uniref:O-phosphoseryl-tRNA(Sec) selenium transferase n=1 Tax=Tribonema minus TaxID=303371 RepID=A0A835ZDK4_9STRA|nr:O-phosphoseryl-tRNA selenium transferase [Tribonema minus]